MHALIDRLTFALAILCLAARTASEAGDATNGDVRAGVAVNPRATGTGLAAEARAAGEAAVGARIAFDLTLRNTGPAVAPLGEGKGAVAWVVIAADKEHAYFTAKLGLEPDGAWPQGLAPGATLAFRTVEAGEAPAYEVDGKLRVTNGYFAAEGLPGVAGQLRDLLPPGRARAKWMVCLPQTNAAAPLLLQAATVDVLIQPPDLKSLTLDARRMYVTALLKRFDHDAWAAEKAHDEAVKLGGAMLPDLIAAAAERQRPTHARLWLATAVADVADERAAQALIALLDDSLDGVRCVVAYHGPKQKSAMLDRAIIDKARAGGDAGFTAYALLGFMVSRGEVPEDLLKAGLESDNPRARAASVGALAGMANQKNVSRLQALLTDPDARVRAASQKVLDAMESRGQ